MLNNISYENNKKVIFSFFSILLIISALSSFRLFSELNIGTVTILKSLIESSIILTLFYYFLYTKKNHSLYLITVIFLKLHVFAIIFQATVYPDMQNFISFIWGTDVAYNFKFYNYRFIGLAGSYVPASILCSLLFSIYFFSLNKTSVLNRYFFMILSIFGCALTARTGILICAAVVVSNALVSIILSKNNILKLLIIFLSVPIIYLIILFIFNEGFLYFIEKNGFGILFQFTYISGDLMMHFSQDWRGSLTLFDYLIGTGSNEFSPGDNGYTMFLSQHGLIILIMSLIPYIFLISRKNLKVAIALSCVIFLAQFKTDFLFSIIYMFFTLNVIKNI